MADQDVIATQLANQFMESYGDSYTILSTAVMPYLPLGCSWGFLDESDIPDLNALAQDPSLPVGTYVARLKNSSYLVMLDYNELVSRIKAKLPSLFSMEDLQRAHNKRVESYKRLEKALSQGNPQVRMGVLSVNESPTITMGDKSFPAFNIDLTTLCQAASQYGYNVMIEGRPQNPSVVAQNQTAALAHLNVAPSKHAILVVLQK